MNDNYYFGRYHTVNECENKIEITSTLSFSTITLLEDDYIQAFQALVRGETCEKADLIQALLDIGALFESKDQEHLSCEVRKKELQALAEQQLLITILPTEKCNFRCWYCYEDFKCGQMTLDVQDKVKSFVAHLMDQSQSQSLQINWFGGEPLLAPSVIRNLSVYFQGFCKEKQVLYSAQMTTNGYLLDLDCAKEMYGLGVNTFQITLDGARHDENRILLNGEGTSEKILKNIQEIANSEMEITVVLRNNISKGQDDREFYRRIARLIKDDPRFVLTPFFVGEWGGQQEAVFECLKTEAEMKEYTKTLNALFSELGLRNFESEKSTNPLQCICPCCYPNAYVVRSDGKLNRCTLALDEDMNHVGDLNNGVNSRDRYWRNSIADHFRQGNKQFFDMRSHDCAYRKYRRALCEQDAGR
ncbi:MAG: radical SAM protein [Eubacteriales bacterium]|nr:radical SAM protein [Eubacteriales bacterium]